MSCPHQKPDFYKQTDLSLSYLTPTPLLKVEGLSVPIAVIIEPGAHPIGSKMTPKKQSAIHGLMNSYCLEVILVT
ncbi:MAG: hypothetical protein LPJ98_09565, partial [Cyclobacteriaceae bacterium]|nr:hypothetical protein [Cyclobacteriaceae bacterium]